MTPGLLLSHERQETMFCTVHCTKSEFNCVQSSGVGVGGNIDGGPLVGDETGGPPVGVAGVGPFPPLGVGAGAIVGGTTGFEQKEIEATAPLDSNLTVTLMTFSILISSVCFELSPSCGRLNIVLANMSPPTS